MSLTYRHANEIITRNSHTLWLGDCSSAEDLSFLKQSSIRTVITAAAGIDIHYDPSIRHYKYLLQDVKTENMLQYFDQICEKIQRGMKIGSVLVHCGAGVSRSATLVIAYLIKYHHMSFREALKYTKSKRPEVCPNLGFQLQLKKYASTKFSALNNIQTPSQSIYKQSKTQWGLRTFLQNSNIDSNQSFPQISRLSGSQTQKNKPKIDPSQPLNSISIQSSQFEAKKDLQKQRQRQQKQKQKNQTQPKGWRITYTLKPQFVSNSLDPKKDAENYIKNIAKFRFGMTNASKWGIY